MAQALSPYSQRGSLSSAEQHRLANSFLPFSNPFLHLQTHFFHLQTHFFPTPALFPSEHAEERVVQNSKGQISSRAPTTKGIYDSCFGSHLSQSAHIKSHLHIPGSGSLWKLGSMEEQNVSGRWLLRPPLLQSSCFSSWDLGT